MCPHMRRSLTQLTSLVVLKAFTSLYRTVVIVAVVVIVVNILLLHSYIVEVFPTLFAVSLDFV